MGKQTIHTCDLCKCPIKGAHATLTVPKAAKVASAANAVRAEYSLLLGMFGGGADRDEKSFDVCVPCAVGLLRLCVSAAELRELESA